MVWPIGATIVNGGKGYVIGDLLEPITIGNQGLGEGMRLTVGNLYGQNQLIVENVQGTFSTGAADNILYRNNSGVTTALNFPGPVNPSEVETVNDGLHFTVFHRNHGSPFNWKPSYYLWYQSRQQTNIVE